MSVNEIADNRVGRFLEFNRVDTIELRKGVIIRGTVSKVTIGPRPV